MYGFFCHWVSTLDLVCLEKFLLLVTGLSQLTGDDITIGWRYQLNHQVLSWRLGEQAPFFHVCLNKIGLPFYYHEYTDFAMMMNETVDCQEALDFTGEY